MLCGAGLAMGFFQTKNYKYFVAPLLLEESGNSGS
jgi:hypothetical protein